MFSSSSSASSTDSTMTMTADESLSSAYSHLMTFFEGSGNLDVIIGQTDAVAKRSLYDSLLKTIMTALKAYLTFIDEDFAIAKQNFEQCFEQSKQLRKTQATTKKFTGFFSSSAKNSQAVIDKFTDLEVHAQFVHAILSVLQCFHKLVTDFSKTQLYNTSSVIAKALKHLTKCRDIADKRTTWESSVSKANFLTAIRLEKGLRNLILSLLPSKLLWVAHFIGIKASDQECAINELKTVAYEQEIPGIYSFFGEMIFLFYWLYLEMHLLSGPPTEHELSALKEVLNKKVSQFPKNIVYKLAKAKTVQITGNLAHATQFYEEIICSDDDNDTSVAKLFYPIAFWELMWTSAVNLNWDEAIKYVQLFKGSTMYPKALPNTLEAIFRYVKGSFNEKSASLQSKRKNQPIEEVIAFLELMNKLQDCNMDHAMSKEGNSFELAKQFFEDVEAMVFPAFDWLYKTNYAHLLVNNAKLNEIWLTMAEDVVNEHDNDSVNRDMYFMALFNKGVLLKHMKLFAEATECFEFIIKKKHTITCNKIAKELVGNASLELGLVALADGDKEAAKNLLISAVKEYTKKFELNLVSLKLMAALRSIGASVDNLAQMEIEVENADNFTD